MRVRDDCRLCGGSLEQVFELPPTPIANSFPAQPDAAAERYPLEVMQCEHCQHVQLHHVPEKLFEDYKYVTPSSTHHQEAAKALRARFPGASTLLEIGCNSGMFLDALRAEDFICLGIDPSASGVGTTTGYFTEKWANEHKNGSRAEYDLIVANNVLAHIDDLHDVFRGVNMALAPEGALVFEVQYLPDLIYGGHFDMIYHEHLDYHTLGPLASFLDYMGFVLTDWEILDSHGGSVRVTAKRDGKPAAIPDEFLHWNYLYDRVDRTIEKAKELVKEPIAAVGAPAKACTLIHTTGISHNIRYVVDDTKAKQGRYIPGTDIFIEPTSKLLPGEPALLLAWNYEDVLQKKFPNNPLLNPFK